jgi:hypothetical protein
MEEALGYSVDVPRLNPRQIRRRGDAGLTSYLLNFEATLAF